MTRPEPAREPGREPGRGPGGGPGREPWRVTLGAAWLADPVTRWCGRAVTIAFASSVTMLLAAAAIAAGQRVLG